MISNSNLFYRGKSDDQGEDDDEGYEYEGEGPPFKSWHSGMEWPDGCNFLESKMLVARKDNSDAPELTCDPKMRQIAKLHGQNMAGRV